MALRGSWVEYLARARASPPHAPGVLDFADGLAAACGPRDVGVLGGELSGGDAVVLSVGLHSDLGGRAPVLRSGARPGDVLAVSGVLGRAHAGMALGPRDH